MKKIQLLLSALFLSIVVLAQENTSGKILYEQVIKLEIKLEGDAAQFADMLPKERKSQKVLYFNNKATLFENYDSAESEDVSMQSGGANVMIRMQEPENKVFIDLEKLQQMEQREFMTRTFLIEGEIQHQWKLTGNQKMILEYPCQEAVLETEKDTISAWFTPVIPVSGGPANYCGLPGMILEVTTKDGKQSTKATSVDFSPFAEDVLTKPGKGKKVTREEYDSIVEEKMKEMGAEQGEGGHQMMIRIQR
jgi:GLPGLI family protein